MARRPTANQLLCKNVMVELSVSHNKACMFCGSNKISEMLYGKLYQLNDVVAHYFCILLSNSVQNGADEEGIWGFLLKDIKAELSRGSKETCIYCKKSGATISCCRKKCQHVFHLPCGLQNGSMHQFFQKFRSFCRQHPIKQTIDITELQKTASVQCAICQDDVIRSIIPSSIWAPCCKRNTWFHRNCIQELALSAGYFFKCPLCNNDKIFKNRMLNLGIYIPSRDASWETVPDAFAELLERPSTCNTSHCRCPYEGKRKFQQESGPWEIILCHTCGSSGTHRKCSSSKFDQGWCCAACQDVADKSNKSNKYKRRRLESPNSASASGISVMLEDRMLTQKREEPIPVSDNGSDESSLQCVTDIDPTKITHLQVVQTPQMQLPLLNRIWSWIWRKYTRRI